MKRYRQYHGSNISFIDMLFNIIVGFVLLFFIAVLLMNPPVKKADIEAKADIIITMSWPDLSPHDIDLWIKNPTTDPIHYNRRENSYLFLDRDDLGVSNNFIFKDGQQVMLESRREVASFRGKVNGRYVANVVFFIAKSSDGQPDNRYDGTPIPVRVELIQINPVYKILAKKDIVLTKIKEEQTAFSFIIQDGLVIDVDLETEELFTTAAPLPNVGP
jgi:hypothetical protein